MVIPQFGGPDLFEERDVERLHPGPGEVQVRVVAAGTNPVDAKFRANGSSAGLEAPIILGADISGVVEEVGPGVTDLAPGDDLYYTPEVFGPRSNGSYAEYHVAKADIVARKPASLSHEEAAAMPLAGATAYEAIVRSGQQPSLKIRIPTFHRTSALRFRVLLTENGAERVELARA
jgi:NADPH2:quinone reductase